MTRIKDEKNSRIWIENVYPEIAAGGYPIKRTVGETVRVSADVFADGHDAIEVVLVYRTAKDQHWREELMSPVGNDHWVGVFRIQEFLPYRYTIAGWIDSYSTWAAHLSKKLAAGQDVDSELLEGAILLENSADAARGLGKEKLIGLAKQLKSAKQAASLFDDLLSFSTIELVRRHQPRRMLRYYDRELPVQVDRARARFGAWYEMFPRSQTSNPKRSATFKEAEKALPRIADMGFDVLYLPPIHPIGLTSRKGRNNSLTAAQDDPGSPWAIGSEAGGHTEIEPGLGTVADFRRFRKSAEKLGLEIALDFAIQCSPDHPYVKEHPDWFYRRPDGTIHYAENPPKKYQDIYPVNFETEDWQNLWLEWKDVLTYWIKQGVKIFRVDNPHTKPFAFWQWVIEELQNKYPEVIFLSEAFTRPKPMYALAKLGFTQSYTYFTWRNTKAELMSYMEELTNSTVSEFYRPNFFCNTPDILPPFLQQGGRPAFQIRLVLAATLSSNYGIYSGYELLENDAHHEKDEYDLNEKYEIKPRNWSAPESIEPLIAKINQIRRANPALHYTNNYIACDIDNEQMLAFLKTTEDRSNVVIVVINLDPFNWHEATLSVPLDRIGLGHLKSYTVKDLLTEHKFSWHGTRNYVRLDPFYIPAHIFVLQQ